MGTLIDTSVLVEAERGRFDLAGSMARQPAEAFAVAAVTIAEILHGLHRAVREEQRIRRKTMVDYVLANYPVLPYGLEAAQVHGRLWAELAAAGINVGAHDLIIAATAIANEMRVATRDLRSFPRIPGLALVQW